VRTSHAFFATVVAALSVCSTDATAGITQTTVTQYTQGDAERWRPTFLGLLERDATLPAGDAAAGVDIGQRQLQRLRSKRYSHLLVELHATGDGSTPPSPQTLQLSAVEGNTATVLSCAQDTGDSRHSRLEMTYTFQGKAWVATTKQFAIVQDCDAPEVMQVSRTAS
jgi:hypothetical protein